jgi:hypothetical protein
MLYLYLTFQMLIVAQIMFQVYDSSNIHSINIREVYILCQCMLMEGQWEKKAVYTFYLELISDLVHLSLYMLLFIAIFL